MRHGGLACILLIILISGCASPAERKFVLDTDEIILWPNEPDLPRYRYVGTLFGEENYVITKERGFNIFDFLTGRSRKEPSKQTLLRPQTGFVDSKGRILVSDTARQAVFVFDKSANNIELWNNFDKDKRFDSPVAIAESVTGDFFISDANLGYVVRVDANGAFKSIIGENLLTRPTGIAYEMATQRLFVVDTKSHKILVFNEDGTLDDTIGRRGEGKLEFNFPTHMAIHGQKLYITDRMNARVQVVTTSGDYVTEMGFRGRNIGNLPHPKGVAVDSDGNVYAVESYFDFLNIFNKDGDLLLSIGGTGNQIGKFFLPAGVWADKNDYIYVADMMNSRVVVLQYLGDL